MSVHKDFRKLLRDLERQGFKVEQTKKNHTVIKGDPYDKNMSPVYIAGTPSDHRTMQNVLSELRQRGYRDRQQGKGKKKKGNG